MWGFGDNEILNKLQLKFYKLVLKLRQSTPSHMIFGETGKFPIDITIKTRILNYWIRLVAPGNNRKLSAIVYKCLCKMYKSGVHENLYVKNIHDYLTDAGFQELWETHDITRTHIARFKAQVKEHIQNTFVLKWRTDMTNSSIYDTYRVFKNNFCTEKYLSILPYNCVITLARFRTTNNLVPVNVLRFSGLDREDRVCRLCDSNEMGNEYHYLFQCTFFINKRRECIDDKYAVNHCENNFKLLLNSSDKKELLKLKHFCDCINSSLR